MDHIETASERDSRIARLKALSAAASNGEPTSPRALPWERIDAAEKRLGVEIPDEICKLLMNGRFGYKGITPFIKDLDAMRTIKWNALAPIPNWEDDSISDEELDNAWAEWESGASIAIEFASGGCSISYAILVGAGAPTVLACDDEYPEGNRDTGIPLVEWLAQI